MTGERRGEMCPYDELAVGWAMHALEPDEEAQVRDHLPGCARCQRTVRSTHEVMAVMGGSVRREEPPPRLRARLMDAIEHTPQEPLPRNRSPRHARPDDEPIQLAPRRRRAKILLAAAAIFAVLGLGGAAGIWINQLSNERAQYAYALQLQADPNASVALLRNEANEPVAMVVQTEKDAAVVPMNLSPNDSGHIYTLWGTSGDKPVALATFDVGKGAVPSKLAWSADAHKHLGFAVSIEPGRTAPTKPSTVLGSGQVA
ncbi:hypothetical protein Lesp02_56010 [Lentzea sp. NBRC 105346]|uniref:anti-sigma factor n=1 Tax=Lentzea sp. NBRC 105346 TaxID=3032205 RepID=UPI0024A1FC19|nr:anti-sigma factor [Lentzea sp. NBRC 105346]GLZ33413.1 hypothetical protein Lesp02_56010 [Lentzea sp. NBRC 105346]